MYRRRAAKLIHETRSAAGPGRERDAIEAFDHDDRGSERWSASKGLVEAGARNNWLFGVQRRLMVATPFVPQRDVLAEAGPATRAEVAATDASPMTRMAATPDTAMARKILKCACDSHARRSLSIAMSPPVTGGQSWPPRRQNPTPAVRALLGTATTNTAALSPSFATVYKAPACSRAHRSTPRMSARTRRTLAPYRRVGIGLADAEQHSPTSEVGATATAASSDIPGLWQ